MLANSNHQLSYSMLLAAKSAPAASGYFCGQSAQLCSCTTFNITNWIWLWCDFLFGTSVSFFTWIEHVSQAGINVTSLPSPPLWGQHDARMQVLLQVAELF